MSRLPALLMIISLVISQSQSFHTCTSGCTCTRRENNDHIVDCSNRGLTSVPHAVQGQGLVGEINLNGNNLQHIQASDFVGTKARRINLGNNNISTIESNAFHHQLEKLILHDNLLSSLPEALKDIWNITYLDVRNNSKNLKNAITLPNDIMKEMGDTIQTFLFGHRDLDIWPDSIRHLQDLKHLTLDHASDILTTIPARAFHSFQSTLLSLTINNTELKATPLGLSNLRRIKEFYFENNVKVGDEGILAQSFVRQPPYASTIETLSLANNKLTQFPRALQYMPNLRSLIMNDNNLHFISDDTVQGLQLRKLTMHNCNLDRIPGALVHLENLATLDISFNNLVTVENNDVQNIPDIRELILSHNPIEFISDSAFGNHSSLDMVDLSDTSLSVIPTAFKITHANKIVLNNNNIDCMCDYVWVKDIKNISIEGCCVNIEESINDYVKCYVPLCPAYIESKKTSDDDVTTLKHDLQSHIAAKHETCEA